MYIHRKENENAGLVPQSLLTMKSEKQKAFETLLLTLLDSQPTPQDGMPTSLLQTTWWFRKTPTQKMAGILY
ncbi:hypothetical protein WT58_23905 [Burkholderia territorii]|nr:hypothetical protein WT58_23905 [Burkholderia territorii]